MKATSRKAPKPTLKDFQALLRSAGLRSTNSRVAVLEYLHAHAGPNSHAELFKALGDKGFERATIYRILMDLVDVDILSRTDLGDHVWRFELKKGAGGGTHGDQHPHFVCIDCGEVSCLPGVSIKLEGHAKAPKSLVKNKVAVQFKGLCDNCI
jgi:Fur family ferric uptake transcriptional regulator